MNILIVTALALNLFSTPTSSVETIEGDGYITISGATGALSGLNL